MGNFSEDPAKVLKTALDKGYRRVRFQQGKPVLDRELNLLGDLADLQRFAQQYLGNGVPDGDKGFAVSGLNVAGNNFTVSAGQCLVAGLEVHLAADTSYRTQPHVTNVGPLPAGPSNVYLRVFETEMTSAEDATMANPADVGFETAVRAMVDFEIVVSVAPIAAADHFLLAVIDTTTTTVTDRRRSGLTLAATRDEISAARGSVAQLGGRLDTTLAPSGDLKAKSVAEPALGDGAVSKRAVADGAIPMQKLAATLVFNGQISVAAAPAVGQRTEGVVSLLESEDPVFLLVSVHYDAPRPLAIPALVSVIEWRQRARLVKPPGLLYHHIYEVVVENPNLFAISATCKAFRLAET